MIIGEEKTTLNTKCVCDKLNGLKSVKIVFPLILLILFLYETAVGICAYILLKFQKFVKYLKEIC